MILFSLLSTSCCFTSSPFPCVRLHPSLIPTYSLFHLPYTYLSIILRTSTSDPLLLSSPLSSPSLVSFLHIAPKTLSPWYYRTHFLHPSLSLTPSLNLFQRLSFQCSPSPSTCSLSPSLILWSPTAPSRPLLSGALALSPSPPAALLHIHQGNDVPFQEQQWIFEERRSVVGQELMRVC